MSDLVGEMLGNYRIEALLGSGGMGEVYRATHVRLNRPAAIKILHAHLAADPSFQARFVREAQAAAALRHPNIVEVFDFGEQAGRAYLVMELVPDGSLRTLLRRAAQPGWSLALGLELVRQAAEGLAYAHRQGMVHRDIKPDNLLLQRRGQEAAADQYALKISDFGLAKLTEGGGELTATGVVMGTPAYMSPEQCQGAPLDARSDLYSLGVVLYEVATGAPPFAVKSLSEAVFKHISAPPPPPRQLRPDLPLELEQVILRCLAKKPEERYATGTELAQALDSALSDTELATVVVTRGAHADLLTPANVNEVAAPPPASTAPEPAVPAVAPHPTPANAPVAVAAASGTDPHAIVDSQATVLEATDAYGLEGPAEVAAAPAVQSPAAARAMRRSSPPPVAAARHTASIARSRLALSLAQQPRKWMFGAVGTGLFALAAILMIVSLQPHAHSSGNTIPTATAPAAPTATPVEAVRFQDPLTTNRGAWATSSHCFFANGGYQIANAWSCFGPTAALGAVTVSVRTRQVSGPTDQFYGIVVRSEGHGDYYFFGINARQQWTFTRMVGSNGHVIVAPTTCDHINGGLNAANILTVRARGRHFVFYINGVQVGEADDAAYATGQIGLTNTARGLEVVYNDFKVTVPA
jgi:hypothetical protein